MLKLIIFDYDGLLVNTEDLAFWAEKELLKKFGVELTFEEFFKFLGHSVRETLEYYKKTFSLSPSLDELERLRYEIVYKLLPEKLELRPGAKELLDFLEKKGIKKVIASSGKREYILKGLEILGIRERFSRITTVDEVKRGKPAPDLFLKALEKEGVNPSQALVLEDSLTGVEAASRAGILAIAIPYFKEQFPQYKDCPLVAKSLKEVRDLLEVTQD